MRSPLSSLRLWANGAALLLALLPFSSYAALLPLIRSEWGMNNAGANLVFSAYLAGFGVSALVLVPLADRYPPRRLWLLGLLLTLSGHALFVAAARSLAVGAAVRAVTAAGHVLALTAGVNMVARRFPGRRASAVALFTACGFVGTTGSYVVTGRFLALTGDWVQAYGATLLIALLGLPLALLRVDPAAAAPAAARRSRRGRLDWRVLRDPVVRRIITAYALHSGDLYVVRLWLPLLLATVLAAGVEPTLAETARAATLAGWMFLLSAAGVFAAGWLADQWGRRSTVLLIYAGGLLAALTIGWLTAGPLPLLIGMGFFYAVVSAADSSLYATMLIDRVPVDGVGNVQAIQSFVGSAVGAIWPVLAGLILDQAGALLGWGGVFSVNGLLIAVGLAALLRLPRALGEAPADDAGALRGPV